MATPSPRAPEPGRPPAPSLDRPRRRTALLVVAAAVAAALAYWVWHGAVSDDQPRFVTAPVDRGAVEQSVTATGTVNPVKTVQVGTYVSGPIIAIDVDFNSPVRQGQRVAKIDPAPFAVKVRQAEATLANSKARVDKDRADLTFKRIQRDRNKTLLARNLIAQNDLDTAQSNYDQAVAQLALDEAAVNQAQASLEAEQVNLRYSDILSPVDGVVVSRNVDVGQTVAASFQTPTLFLIAEDLTKMQVDTNVSESDVGRVALAQAATFNVDAYPGQAFHGVVSQVRNAPITVQNVVTYDVVIAVDNTGLELKPGMTANVTITTAKRDDVLRVPVRALRFRPDSAETPASPAAPATPATTAPSGAGAKKRRVDTTVYVLRDGTPTPVELKIGIRDAQYAEVLGGPIAAGDVVVTGIQREAAAAPVQPPSFAGGRRRF